jgi:hypothetical protein
MRKFILLLTCLSLNLIFCFSSKAITIANEKPYDTINSNEIKGEQIKELHEIAVKHLFLVQHNYIKNGVFLPVAFVITSDDKSQVVVYEKSSKKGKHSTEYIYQKLDSILNIESRKENIRISCIIFNGIIKNDKYPKGNECIAFRFNSREIDDIVVINFAVRIVKGELLFGDTVIQREKK